MSVFSPQVLSLLQDRGHSVQHDIFLRHGTTRGGDNISERQQDHLGHDQGAHGRDAVQNKLHEVQGTCLLFTWCVSIEDNDSSFVDAIPVYVRLIL